METFVHSSKMADLAQSYILSQYSNVLYELFNESRRYDVKNTDQVAICVEVIFNCVLVSISAFLPIISNWTTNWDIEYS